MISDKTVSVAVLEDTRKTIHLVIPEAPQDLANERSLEEPLSGCIGTGDDDGP